jgi:probable F420-dependent oxidoreductase
MKVDGGVGADLSTVGAQAQELEGMGYSGIMTAETSHDPFFPLLVAAQNTEKVELITSIAVAFARTPMVLANIGHDLNSFSKGRFVLGLGSQIRPHITKRFSMPWSSPAARMREFILAMRAIWGTWHEGKPLEFTGKYYTHTLMTPMFTPTDIDYGAPKVMLAAVGPKMTEAAGEVADGMIVHAFTTEKYLRGTTIPALERGMATSGRRREDFEISYPVFVVTGQTEEEIAQSKIATAKQIAFYGSTPAYKLENCRAILTRCQNKVVGMKWVRLSVMTFSKSLLLWVSLNKSPHKLRAAMVIWLTGRQQPMPTYQNQIA